MEHPLRWVRSFVGLTMVAVIAGFLPVESASATQGDPHRVTICHRTRAVTNPYVRITVDSAAVDQETGNDHGQGDHNAEHQGPVATSTAVATAIKNGDSPYEDAGGFWGDIIPPFYADGTTQGYWPSLNWVDENGDPTDGQTVFENGCNVGEEAASLLIRKTIPSVIEGEEMVVIRFVLTVHEGYPNVEDDVVAMCDFVFDGNSDPQECEIGNLPVNTTFDLWETDSGAFTPMDPNPLEVSTGANGSETEIQIDNTFGPATAQACKVTNVVNGAGFDASGVNFTFDLKVSDVVIDTVVVAGGGTATESNCEAFDASLDDNVTYSIVERTPPTGWTNNGGSGDCTFTPQYPDDADRVFTCTYTNTITFSARLTPGYWKTHLAPLTINGVRNAACSGLPSGTSCSSNGPWTSQYLQKTLGSYTVDTILKAAQVFAAMNCSNTGSASQQNQNAIGCLAGHLLAAKLNVANGADATCISGYITQADTFLVAIPKSPSGTISYSGPSGTYTSITAAARATAISLKTKLDTFNNGGGCV